MVYCGSFGCSCCTCEECGNWLSACKCETYRKVKDLQERVEEFELSGEDAQARGLLLEAIRLLKELS
jgi:hypothetical protein